MNVARATSLRRMPSRRTAALGALAVVVGGLSSTVTPAVASAEEPSGPGSRWTDFAPYVGPLAGPARAMAFAPDGSLLLVAGASQDHAGVAKVDVPSGAARADFGRSGYADLAEVIPSGDPMDLAPRADGGAYLLLENAKEPALYDDLRLQPDVVGVAALTGEGSPDTGFGTLPGYGEIGVRYLGARAGATITGVGGIAPAAHDHVVLAYTENRPGEVSETNPAPRPATDVVLRRLGPDGEVDPTYGDGGLARWVFPDQLRPDRDATVEVERVRATASGAVVVLVKTESWDPTPGSAGDVVKRLHLLRLTPDGDLDPTFGDGGAVEVPGSLPDCARDFGARRTPMALGDDGAIVVASARPRTGTGRCDGGEAYESETEILVNVFEPDGDPDTTFSADGRLTHHLSEPAPHDPSIEWRPSNRPDAVLVDRLGRVVVQDQGHGLGHGAFVRFDDRGALDTTFGAGGHAFNAPSGYDGGDLLEAPSGDYLAAGAPGYPAPAYLARASLYLADADQPVAPAAPAASPEDQPRIVLPTDRAARPGDDLTLDLGTWTGPAIDHYEVAVLGCEPRHSSGQRCFDRPLQRFEAPGGTEALVVEVPAVASGQQLSADVVAVTAEGVRGTAVASGGPVGPSRHLIEAEPPAGQPDVLPGGIVRQGVYALPDGTTGSVHVNGHAWELNVTERAPDDVPRLVLRDTGIVRPDVLQVVTATDGWVHALLLAGKDLHVLTRDPSTGTWSGPHEVSRTSAEGAQALSVSANALQVAPGGRAVVAWAEPVARGEGEAPPVALRVHGPGGWSPIRYVSEPASYQCPGGGKSCYPYPDSDGTMDPATRPVVSIAESGAVLLTWTRGVAAGWSNGRYPSSFALRVAADGTQGPVQLLSPFEGRRVTPISMTALADGSTLVLAQDVVDVQDGEHDLVLQQVPAGAQVQASDGTAFPGTVLRRYRRTETVRSDLEGDPRWNDYLAMAADGTHWRLVLTESRTRVGGQRFSVLHLSGTGDEVGPVQVLDRRADGLARGGSLDLGVASGGKAYLVAESQANDHLSLEYAVAEGNGPMTTLEPIAAEYAGGSTVLDGPPASSPVGDDIRGYVLLHRAGSWTLTTAARDDWMATYRLARGVAGPRVAIDSSRSARPGKPFTLTVDEAATYDPDGGELDFAWDTDLDGAFDDGTGDSVTVTAGPVNVEQEVAVRATSTDGDSARALGSVYPVENEAPEVYSIEGPGTPTAGTPTGYTAEAWDDGGPDQLTFAWSVNGTVQPDRTGPAATLTLPAGQVVLKVRVTDADGASAEVTRTVTATADPLANEAPQVSLAGPDRVTAGKAATYTAQATDDGGAAALTYRWSVDGEVVAPSAASASLVLAAGTRTVAVTVTDPQGLSATASRKVTVAAAPALSSKPVKVGAVKGRKVSIAVTVPAAGSVTVVLRHKRKSTVYASEALQPGRSGTVSTKVTLTKAGRKALGKKGRAPALAVTTYTPAGGAAQVRTQKVTLKR